MEKHDDPPAAPGPLGPPVGPPVGWNYRLRQPTNSMAIAALVVGLVSMMSCPLIGAVAVYLGNRARAEIAASGEEGDGMALAGLIIGWVALGLTVLSVLFFGAYLVFVGTLLSASSPG